MAGRSEGGGGSFFFFRGPFISRASLLFPDSSSILDHMDFTYRN